MSESDSTFKDTHLLVWMDLETTGLDPNKERILQIAGVLTDIYGTPLQDSAFEYLILHPNKSPQSLYDSSSKVVQDMHRETGLWRRLASEDSIPLGIVSNLLTNLVGIYQDRYGYPQDARKPQLAGSSIGFDKAFIDKHMPKFAEILDYRVTDTTVIRQTALRLQRLTPENARGYPPTSIKHDARFDIKRSLAEYRYLMNLLAR